MYVGRYNKGSQLNIYLEWDFNCFHVKSTGAGDGCLNIERTNGSLAYSSFRYEGNETKSCVHGHGARTGMH